MNRFWSLAAAQWPLSIPRRRLEAITGGALTRSIVSAGLLELGALHEGDAVPCGGCGRFARLVAEPEGLVAVCPEECPVEPFGPEPARLFVEPSSWARRLAEGLRLDGTPGEEGPVVPLGRRKVGEETVAFDLVPRPRRPEVLERLYRLARGGPSVRVLLAPDSSRLPADAPTEIVGVELVWTGLDELVTVDEGLRVDLDALTARRSFRGFRAEPAVFAGLTVDARGATWAGVRVALDGAPLLRRLLTELAARPGQVVTRDELWRSLYPDDFTRQGNLARGVNPDDLNDRLRGLVGKLRLALQAVARNGTGPTVENSRGSETVGGYVLALRPEMVRSS